eukprot:6073053-Pleurochrysis_carterae.AAC.2
MPSMQKSSRSPRVSVHLRIKAAWNEQSRFSCSVHSAVLFGASLFESISMWLSSIDRCFSTSDSERPHKTVFASHRTSRWTRAVARMTKSTSQSVLTSKATTSDEAELLTVTWLPSFVPPQQHE